MMHLETAILPTELGETTTFLVELGESVILVKISKGGPLATTVPLLHPLLIPSP